MDKIDNDIRNTESRVPLFSTLLIAVLWALSLVAIILSVFDIISAWIRLPAALVFCVTSFGVVYLVRK